MVTNNSKQLIIKPLLLCQDPVGIQGPEFPRKILAASVAAALIATPVFAQEDDPAGGTVLDTLRIEAQAEPDANPYADPQSPYKVDRSASEKYTEDMVDTSKSITVIPKEVIKDSGATSLKDVLMVEPGITIGTGEGGNAFGDRFIIRGFEARNDVFVDGLRDPGVIVRETFAVEQIEISKGPSSTFAGRGTTGGAVNSVSKMPMDESFSKLTAGLGTDSFQRYTIDTNQTVSDMVTLRVNALYHDADVAGRDHVAENREGAAIASLFRLTDDLRLTLDHYHLKTDDIPDGGVPWNTADGAPYDVDRSNFYGQLNRDFWETKADISTVKLEYDFTERLRLSSQTRYGKTGNTYVITVPSPVNTDPTLINANAQSRDQTNEYIGHQTNLIMDLAQGDVGHTVVVGIEVTKEEVENNPFTVTPRGVQVSAQNPDPYTWNGTVTQDPSTANIDVKTTSVYVMDNVTLSRQWEVFGGLRYDSFDVETFNIANDYTETGEAEASSNFINWHVGGVYKPRENGSIYLAYSTSSNPPGEQLDAGGIAYGGLDVANQNIDPEENHSIELGTKWNLVNDDLALTAAVFETTKENAVVSTGNGATAAATAVGTQQVRGIEIGFAGRATDDLSLFGGVAVLDTEITEANDPDQVGRKMPNVAENSATVRGKYQLTSKLALGAAAIYTGEIFGGTPNAGATVVTTSGATNSIPGNTRYDLLAEYQITDDLKTRLNVLNATDKVYYTALYRSQAPFTYVGAGRSTTLTLEYDF